MLRVVRPEILDSLPHDHPDALQNRRELRTINWLMGNYRWLAHQARRRLEPRVRALELGAGSGDLVRRLRRGGVPIELDGLDLCPPPEDWDDGRKWIREDLQVFDGYEGYHAIFGNLILHQFPDEVLGQMGRRMRVAANQLFFCEPARRNCHVAQFRALSLLGRMGHVSRNDGEVSIRAGFLGDELPHLLGLTKEDWRWSCKTGLRGQYLMAAWRVGPS
ncbi:hypothetical protein [Pelagicoccus sp. SDUM812002]|uniref:hypothetical protein n=1 Tax=Pelagicoccus sp. SDUM812002 TaxID=3041266 RepID=UPI00280E9974|nr:hypothetical protein [Pelagicoccus sp. SDUM812002]MDQ8186760.1 hypothetical protein [Pelagicoccus sp. SDUM812002]